MRDDINFAIKQISERIAAHNEFEKQIFTNSGKDLNYKRNMLEKDQKTFLKELKLFSNQFDNNLKEVVNEFFAESRELHKINIKP